MKFSNINSKRITEGFPKETAVGFYKAITDEILRGKA